jgi:hypothetical protein
MSMAVNFTLFSRGNSGWVENAAEEPQLVAAMKAGTSMTVKAISRRGTNTSYSYSLKGVTAASEQDCELSVIPSSKQFIGKGRSKPAFFSCAQRFRSPFGSAGKPAITAILIMLSMAFVSTPSIGDALHGYGAKQSDSHPDDWIKAAFRCSD